MNDDLLELYLQDHLAGSLAAIELARRVQEENQGNEFGDALREIREEFEAERRELRLIIDGLNLERSRFKLGAAWFGEKVTRLATKGRLGGYSMLGRVVELESLLATVQTRVGVWRTLQSLSEAYPALESFDLEGFERQARNQLERLDKLHQRAARKLSASGRSEQRPSIQTPRHH